MYDSSCFMCDGHVVTPVAYVEKFPLCSLECKEHWDILSQYEQLCYIQCMRAIHVDGELQ
jgi:hypothetical protein